MDFLGWLSTICPLIPHLTYPLLLVLISTIPEQLLPLRHTESGPLSQLFLHLWSPIDARLLSTHSLPDQHSAFQQFFQAAIDSTFYLIGKPARSDKHDVAEWMLRQQLVTKGWIDGVLELGAKGGRRRGQDVGAEYEAEVFGKALDRLAITNESLLELALPSMQESFCSRCFDPEHDEGPARTGAPLLHRSLSIIDALKRSTDNDRTLTALRDVVNELVGRCIGNLTSAVVSSPSTASMFASVIIRAAMEMRDDLKPEMGQVSL